MTEENIERRRWQRHGKHGGGNAVYLLGFIGAAVFYVQTAATLAYGLLGLLKALVWPALLVYKVLQVLAS